MTEAKQQLPENKMGTMPVGKLIFSMSVPMMISMIVQALYNIVDSIFVSMISEQALTAVSLAFPLQSLMIAFSTGIGVGINAHLSRALGEKKLQRAKRTAASGLLLELCFALLFVLTGIFLAVPFFRAQTAAPEIFSYGVLYTRIVCCGSLGIFAEITFERFLQSTGRTTLSMYSQLSGALFNLVMDPVLIFGLFGAPKLGIAGAALATVLGQHLSALVAILLNQTKNPEVKLHAKSFGFYPELLGHILAVGIPSTIMQALSSFMVYAMNQILISFTATATAILGVYFKISSLIFMPVFGLNNGTVPILAYNYGAGHKRRILRALKISVLTALGFMTVGLLLFELLPGLFFRLFHASANMLSLGIPALRIIGLCLPFVGFSIATSSAFQALGKGYYSMLVSICRQLLFLLPTAYLLAKTGVLQNVWWSIVIAEGAGLFVSLFFLLRSLQKIVAPIPDDHVL